MEIFTQDEYHWRINFTYVEILKIRALAQRLKRRPRDVLIDIFTKELNKQLKQVL